RCLTGPEIQKQLAAAPRPWSAWTVRRALARMVRQGHLLHQAGGPGLGGYGLPEWEWSESRTQAANLKEDPRSRCRQNILQVLRDVGLPLTRALLLPAMVERGFPWSEAIVTQALDEMTREGILLYHQGPPRPGYGLPEWEPPVRRKRSGRQGRGDH
ncbi:MAG: hypothetical protein JO112_19230, partial [Planctomycetes bacterium]|nr:hypothetical protein [Planctomycetota bacterium]